VGLNSIPVIDPNVKHVGVSKLRELNATKLRETKEDTLVIQDNNQPLAVLFSYGKFMEMQQQLMSAFNTIELLTNKKELAGLMSGVADMEAGRVRTLDEIEADLKKKHG